MKKHTISLKVNGVARTLEVEPSDLLNEVLRDKVGTKSVKVGCDRGDCGTCTVLLNGRAVRSCLVLAAEADGSDILTLEGISKEGGAALQKALHKRNSFQCGFCAPGMILSAHELLRKNPHPTDADIREAIAGNLCRCTGYTPIVEGIAAAAKGGK